jgi:SAM-dependent methyltransferase
VDGIPVLLDERKSVFSIEDYIAHKETFFNDADGSKNRLRKLAVRLVPSINRNVRSRENYRQLGNLLLRQCSTPRVLVIGGSILGQGMEALTRYGSLDLVETDVSLGPRTALVCDAHDLPFKDESFDCVIAQAVLEHVVDPYACVEEAHRVLKPGGLIYAETPFIQQVHGGRFDFTRFTYLGHRRLFRNFEEISSGATCGPGMALAWSYQYFLLSFTTSRRLRGLIRVFAALTSFYLKYFDAFLINKPAALDAASSYFFVGRRVDEALPDRDLIQLYKR